MSAEQIRALTRMIDGRVVLHAVELRETPSAALQALAGANGGIYQAVPVH